MHYMYVTVHNVQHYIHFVRCVCVSYMYVTHTITQRTKLHESNCTQRTTLHLCYKYTTYNMHYRKVTVHNIQHYIYVTNTQRTACIICM